MKQQNRSQMMVMILGVMFALGLSAFVTQSQRNGTMAQDLSAIEPAATETSTPANTATNTQVAETATPTNTATPVPGEEILVNGDYETDAESDGIPDGWTQGNATGDKVKCNDGEKIFSYTGLCAYRFKGSVGENSKLIQNVTPVLIFPDALGAGDELTVSGFVWAKGTVNAFVKVRITYTNISLEDGKITVKFKTPTGGYVPFSGSVVLAADTSNVKLMLQNKGTAGKVLFDAVSLKISNDVTPPAGN